MKRRISPLRLQRFIIDIYNNPTSRNIFIETLKNQKNYKGYDHNSLINALYTNLDNLIRKAVSNNPLTDMEKESIEDTFIILSRLTRLREKDKNLAVLMKNYFVKFPTEEVNTPKERNLTFLNIITTIITSHKVGNMSVTLSDEKKVDSTGPVFGMASNYINYCDITMYHINDKTFEDIETYYLTIYAFLHEFGHSLQYRKKTFLSSHKTSLFEMESRILTEDYETYLKYYDGLELEYEANCIAKDLMDTLLIDNNEARTFADKQFSSDKKAYEESLEEFLGYLKRTYSFKLKRD